MKFFNNSKNSWKKLREFIEFQTDGFDTTNPCFPSFILYQSESLSRQKTGKSLFNPNFLKNEKIDNIISFIS